MSATRLRRPLSASASLLLTGALALTGCAVGTDDGTDSAVTVAASFYPLEFIARGVGGDLIEVEGLAQPGQDPHGLELSVAQTGLLSRADLVLLEEALQPGVAEAVEQNGTGEVLDVEDVIDLAPLEDDQDPHFWLDPLLMAEVATAVGERLGEVDSANAEEYAANAASLVEELEQLDRAFVEGLADCERDTVVVSHDAFGYLTRYGLDLHGIAGLSPDAEPTPATRAELERLIRAEGVTTVFSERLAPRSLADSLARDVGVRTQVLDPVEGLTEDTADQDYLSLMEQNLAALQEANGCR